jgi:DNA polymerase (family X)
MQLMELHDENVFKIRGYQSAIINIEREGKPLAGLDIKLLQEFPGIGKGIAEVILDIQKTGSHPLLAELLEKTPQGILEILEIKGLGPKKIKMLWQELEITSVHELHEACLSGQVAKIKGFGQKTQESIIEALEFIASNQGKWLFADLEMIGNQFLDELRGIFGSEMVAPVGDSEENQKSLNSLLSSSLQINPSKP